jgi:hypothetical protein
MAIKTQVSELLNKEMDRQDFLKHIAIGLVALSGFGAVLRYAAPKQGHNQTTNSLGYGSSAYGGSSEHSK